MPQHGEPDALVVGAGPVGLVAALFLQEQGAHVELVDMNQRTTQHSYALAVHPATLRVLDAAGVSGELIARGRKVTTVAFYEGSERRAAIDFSALSSSHPYLLVLRQSDLERTLQEALASKKLEIRWAHRLQALRAGDGGIEADVASLDQVATGYPVARTEWVVADTRTVHPACVIGADGYDSTVRRMAGIEMTDQGSPEVFSVFEIQANGELPGEVRVILDPDRTSVYWPLEPGRCRWGFQIADSAEHSASVGRLQQLLAARAPWFPARIDAIYWSTVGIFERRLATRFGQGRVWLAGDAAHQAAPVGVHSMNAGIREARELASRIVGIARSGGSPALLDEFGKKAHEDWQSLVGAGRDARALPGAGSWVERNRARILACTPASGEDLAPLLAQIGLAAAL